MSGFNGAAATPVNSNAASKQRDVLSVYSKTQVDSAISQSTATIDLGSFASLSAIETALNTFGASLSDNNVKNVRFAVTASASPFIGTTYIGTFTRTFSDRYQVTFNENAGLKVVHGTKNSSGWSWESTAGEAWIDLTVESSNFTSGAVRYKKIGNVIYMTAYNLSASKTGLLIIASLPVDARPSQRWTAKPTYPNLSGDSYINITTDGNLQLNNASGGAVNNVYFTAVYPTN